MQINLELGYLLEVPWHVVATLTHATQSSLGFNPKGRWHRPSIAKGGDGGTKVDMEVFVPLLWTQAAQFDRDKYIVTSESYVGPP